MTDTNVPTVQLPTTIDAMVDQFVRVRDAIKQVEEDNKNKLAPAKEYLEQLNGAILEKLTEVGLESAKTKFGTAYKTVRRSATIADGQAFRDFITGNGMYDLVDWRANAVAVGSFIDANNGELPPGVNYSTFVQIGVRRK